MSLVRGDDRPLRIGMLDENGNDEYHGMLLAGIFEAAKTHGAEVIRIGHFFSNDTSRDPAQVRHLLQYARQFRLDGLLFLGWARFCKYGNEELFRSLFSEIPLFSVGVAAEDLPCALFDGDPYIEELLLHLILTHGYRQVAFIEPFNPDGRAAVYHRIMRQKGLTDPRLLVEASLLEGLSVPERGRRALEILLDERKVVPEVVMSLYNKETEGIIKELQDRGIRVPEDMAVTSYEDGELGRYETPAYTTILFPWHDLGRVSGDLFLTRLARLRRNRERAPSLLAGPASGLASVMGFSGTMTGALPVQVKVPGQVLLRASCGCRNEWKPLAESATGSTKSLLDMTEYEWVRLSDRISGQVTQTVKARLPDFRALLMGFRMGLLTGNRRLFLNAVEAQMDLFLSTELFRDNALLLDVFRQCVLPYADKTPAMLLTAEDMLMQADAMLAERELRIWGERERTLKVRNRLTEDVGQILIAQYTLTGLVDALAEGLLSLGIPSCLLVLTDRQECVESRFFKCVPLLCLIKGSRMEVSRWPVEPAESLLERFLSHPDLNVSVVSNLLNVGGDISGFVLYEASMTDERIYSALSSHISTAIAGVFLTERVEKSFQRLVGLAHKEGMSHAASGVLHNIRNVLGSLTTTAQRMQTLLLNSPIADLEQAVSLLESQADPERFLQDDPRAESLLMLLRRLEAPLAAHRQDLTAMMDRLQEKNIGIRDLLVAQQDIRMENTRLEACDAVSMMEEALTLGMALSETASIRIERAYEEPFPVLANASGLLHALVNLVRNACESMMESQCPDPMLTVSLRREGDKGVFLIQDNGKGLEDAQLSSLFLLGHTTKPNGHGIGLHSSANDITAMGGSIHARSDGSGCGAVFEIRMPLLRE